MVNPLRLVVASFLANGAVPLEHHEHTENSPRRRPALASPGPGPNGFSVAQVSNPNFEPYGPAQLAKIHRKYGVPIPENLSSAIKRHRLASHTPNRRTTGSVTAVPQISDVEFLSPVQIGTPAQTLIVDFDTGSSDFWVFSTATDTAFIAGQRLYNVSQSSSATKIPDANFSISYGDGSSCSGDVYTDTVTIGGVTFPSQAVEVATYVSPQFTIDVNSDGIVGLGFSIINTVYPQRQNTFFDNVVSTLDEPLFTADLKAGQPGTYNFGWIDHDAFYGDITYTDVDPSPYGSGLWVMNIQGYSITPSGASDAVKLDNFTNEVIAGVADTGSTLLLLPRALVKEYYSYIPNAMYDDSEAGWCFPCGSELPDFSFGVEMLIITIPAKYLTYGRVHRGTDNERCYGSIQYDNEIGMPVFGDVALKSAFVVFDNSGGGPDYMRPRIGWANKYLY